MGEQTKVTLQEYLGKHRGELNITPPWTVLPEPAAVSPHLHKHVAPVCTSNQLFADPLSKFISQTSIGVLVTQRERLILLLGGSSFYLVSLTLFEMDLKKSNAEISDPILYYKVLKAVARLTPPIFHFSI